MNGRLASLALLATLSLTTLAGCGDVPGLGMEAVRGPRSWIFSAELTAGQTFTVAVTDKTGRIDDAAVDPPGVNPVDGVANADGEPNVVLVPWTGGACDARTSVSIERAGTGEGLIVRFRTQVAPGDCDAIGIGHVLRLTATAPLPAGDVELVDER